MKNNLAKIYLIKIYQGDFSFFFRKIKTKNIKHFKMFQSNYNFLNKFIKNLKNKIPNMSTLLERKLHNHQ